MRVNTPGCVAFGPLHENTYSIFNKEYKKIKLSKNKDKKSGKILKRFKSLFK